jgi:uncharacterized membrane protein
MSQTGSSAEWSILAPTPLRQIFWLLKKGQVMTPVYSLTEQPPRSELSESDWGARHGRAVNVGPTERQVSLVGGGLLLVTGFMRRDLPGLLIAGLGGALAYRGVTGHCHIYRALGVRTPDTAQSLERPDAGIEIAESFLIDKPVDELYFFWRDFENLPRVMTHLKYVERIDNRRSHWVATAPAIAGGSIEWDATIIEDKLNSLIVWQSEPGSQIDHRGAVEFKKAPGDRGTAVRVHLVYAPPAGALGRWIVKFFGSDPESLIREDLRNFKRFMEIGDVLTTEGQPRGACFAGVGRLLH